MKTGGRPVKLTVEVLVAITTALRGGAFMNHAATLAGVDRCTIYRWLRRGHQQRDGIYAAFAREVARADAEAQIRDLLNIRAAADRGVWQAAAWKLERRHPKQWGRRVQVIDLRKRRDKPKPPRLIGFSRPSAKP